MAASTRNGVKAAADRQVSRHVEIQAQPGGWMFLAAGGLVPLGLAITSAVASRYATERVAVTAWIATAVVGTAAVVSAAAASRSRTRDVSRHRHAAGDDSSGMTEE